MDPSGLREIFRERFGTEPGVLVRAPGRVNLIGEHTDYNEGFVLPAAIDRALWLAVRRAEGESRIVSEDLSERRAFRVRDLRPGSVSGWASYPAGVAWALRERGDLVPDLDVLVASDLPMGSGLASSAAFEVASALAWRRLAGVSVEGVELAKLCRKAENEFVGVRCRIMDPLVCLMGVAGHALWLDCRSLAVEPVPLPPDLALVVADTGVRRRLEESLYNERRKECEEASRWLRGRVSSLQSLRDLDLEKLQRFRGETPETLFRRARHVVTENRRVLDFAEAARKRDLAALGRFMAESHASLCEDFEASCPELEAMVGAARKIEGAIGSRMTGAGFGGCTVSLVVRDRAEEFRRRLASAYREAVGREPSIYLCEVSGGAGFVD